jgi:alpha-beta hydrolase superfamily lysophospholipase
MRESAAVFGSAGSLVGIVSEPSDGPGRAGLPGVIFLNSGVIHRVGPNRMYVRMARDLARQGFVAFRFDLSGVGDSPARGAGSTIEGRWVDETREAMDHLHRTRELGSRSSPRSATGGSSARA